MRNFEQLSDQSVRQFKIIHETRSVSAELGENLTQLARLIANVTESYTSAVFLCVPGADLGIEDEKTTASTKRSHLRVAAYHTLSREFVRDAVIQFGTGLVGWTAENGLRISVCPFEHDATTLLYYGSNQDLKSFIAVPILKGGTLFGVIACDSKKSYAYAKITEKVLNDCALQAASMIELHSRAEQLPESKTQIEDALEQFANFIRNADSEEDLLTRAANIPDSIVRRDALVVVTSGTPALAEGLDGSRPPVRGRTNGATGSYGGGFGAGQSRTNGSRFYTPALPTERPNAAMIMSPVDPRLLELVQRHRRVMTSSRSVHSLPIDDAKQRSFLSVPFMMLGREAGSINLLSPQRESFKAQAIAAVERIAEVVGREIERIRLRELLPGYLDSASMMSWRRFVTEANSRLKEWRQGRLPLSLIRIAFTNSSDWESQSNIDEATDAFRTLIGLVEQVKRNSALSCYLFGEQALILTESNEAEATVRRLRRIIERSGMGMTAADAEMGLPSGVNFSVKLSRSILAGLVTKLAHAPADGATIEELVKKTALTINLGTYEPQFSAKMSEELVSGDRTQTRDKNLTVTDREELDDRKWALGTR